MKRKNILCLCMAVLLVSGFVGCGTESRDNNAGDSPVREHGGTENSGSQESFTGNSDILIAYFSIPEDVETTDAVAGASIVVRGDEKMGNTEYVAKIIQETVGGDLFRIETAEEYPLDHDLLVDQAAEEQDAGLRPALSSQVEDFERYETVILGFAGGIIGLN